MIELIQKYVKDDGVVGLDNFDCWRTSSAAIKFLSTTTSVSSVEGLKKVVLLPTSVLKLMCPVAVALDRDILGPWGSNQSCMVCLDFRTHLLLIHTSVR